MKFLQVVPSLLGLVLLSLLGGCGLEPTTTPDGDQSQVDSPTPESPDPTPTPAVGLNGTGTPSPDPTPEPTPSPTPTPAPAPTPTPSPTPAPTPSPTPAPTPGTPQAAQVEMLRCNTTMARVDDPTAPLNVRSQPQVAEGNIVGQLDDRAWVTVVGEESGWWRISNPESGWISKNLTDSSCNEMVAQLSFPANATRVRISDRIVGAGFHEYRLEAIAQQTMTITALNDSPLPFVRAPNGREITDAASMQGRSSWTGELPATGEYILEYNSNFQGFEYETLIEIR